MPVYRRRLVRWTLWEENCEVPSFSDFLHLKRVNGPSSGFGVRGPEFAPWKVALGNVVPLDLGGCKAHGSPTSPEAHRFPESAGQVPASGPLRPSVGPL